MKNLNNKSKYGLLPILHGENFLQPVYKLPEGNTQKVDMFVVGHSESGHNHVLSSKKKNAIEVLESESARYVLINEVSQLFHQKSFDVHETITVNPGIYKITHKTEYDPFQQVIRRVWD